MNPLSQRKTDWITPSFGNVGSNFLNETSLQISSRSTHAVARKDCPKKDATGPSTAGVSWVEKYKPSNESELAVQKKKFAELKQWLVERLKSPFSKEIGNILVIDGPTGAGKTTAVHVLCLDLHVEIQEWNTPISLSNEEFSSWKDFKGLLSESQKKQFHDFLLRANKYQTISEMNTKSDFSQKRQKIILVEDIPNVFNRNTADFHDILRNFQRQSRNPLIFVISDSNASESNFHSLFPKYFQLELRIACIRLNPVTLNTLKKTMSNIVAQERELAREQIYIPSKETIDLIAENSCGDIRACINSLQFFCTNDYPAGQQEILNHLSKKISTRTSRNRKRLKAETKKDNPSAFLFGKDTSLILFRSIGKILYTKRKEKSREQDINELPSHLSEKARDKLLIDPEDVIQKTQVASENLMLYLHQNYLAFCNDIDDASFASNYFSDADFVSSHWSSRDVMKKYSISMATRGLIFTKQGKKAENVTTGCHPFCKPRWFGTLKETSCNRRNTGELFRDSRCPAVELYLDVLPFLALASIPLPSPMKKKQRKEPKTTKEGKKSITSKKDSELHSKLMDIYEKLRRKSLTVGYKQEIISNVLDLTEGNEKDFIFKHDYVRVFEFCVKFGNKEQRERLFKIFTEHSIELLKSKYAKHLVKKLVKHGNKTQRCLVIKALYGNVKRLAKHKEASGIIEYIYHKFADSSQRASLIEEFYGPEYAVFKAAIGRKLSEIFEKEPHKKLEILRHMKDVLTPYINKESVTLTIIHRPLLEFFTHADGSLRSEMIESLRERTVHMLHTHEGSRVTMKCIWFGTPKDRKIIIKSFKGFSKKICMEEYGHLCLLAAFDVIDDTVFVTKTILSEIMSQFEPLIEDQYGRKVILYLLNGRDKRFFNQQYIENLSTGDDNATSKKNAAVRRAELRRGILDPLLGFLKPTIEEILKDKSKCQILLAAMEHSEESEVSQDIMNEVINLISTDIHQLDHAEDHVIFHPCGHWVIKRLIQQDKLRVEKDEKSIFSKLLVKAIPEHVYGNWVQHNRGAFVTASLLESGLEDVTMPVKQSLLSLSSKLQSGQTKGMDLIMKLIGLKE